MIDVESYLSRYLVVFCSLWANQAQYNRQQNQAVTATQKNHTPERIEQNHHYVACTENQRNNAQESG